MCMNQTCVEPHAALAPCHPPVWLRQGEHWPVQTESHQNVTEGQLWSCSEMIPGQGSIPAWPTFPSTACEVCQHLCLNRIINKRLLSGVLSFFSPFCHHSFFPVLYAFPFLLWGVQSKQQFCIFSCMQL